MTCRAPRGGYFFGRRSARAPETKIADIGCRSAQALQTQLKGMQGGRHAGQETHLFPVAQATSAMPPSVVESVFRLAVKRGRDGKEAMPLQPKAPALRIDGNMGTA